MRRPQLDVQVVSSSAQFVDLVYLDYTRSTRTTPTRECQRGLHGGLSFSCAATSCVPSYRDR